MTVLALLLQLISAQLQIDGEIMNIITKVFLSALLSGGLMYGMDADRQKFNNMYQEFSNFTVTPTNKKEFKEQYEILLLDAEKFKQSNLLINNIKEVYLKKTRTLPKSIIGSPIMPLWRDDSKLESVKKELFSPHLDEPKGKPIKIYPIRNDE